MTNGESLESDAVSRVEEAWNRFVAKCGVAGMPKGIAESFEEFFYAGFRAGFDYAHDVAIKCVGPAVEAALKEMGAK